MANTPDCDDKENCAHNWSWCYCRLCVRNRDNEQNDNFLALEKDEDTTVSGGEGKV